MDENLTICWKSLLYIPAVVKLIKDKVEESLGCML